MINVKKIEGENILSYKDIDFEFGKGVFLVSGKNEDSKTAESNYSGKTNLFESVLWGLYGTLAKWIAPDGSLYPQVDKTDIIRYGQDECSLKVLFESNGSEYIVERSRTRKAGKLSLYCNGNNISEATSQKTQEALDDILGISFQTFVQSVFFAQGSKRLMQCRDVEIKQVFDDILVLNLWEEARNKLRVDLRNAEREVNEIKRENEYIMAEIRGIESAINVAIEDYNKKKEQVKEFDKVKLDKIKDIDARIEELKKKIPDIALDDLIGNEEINVHMIRNSLRDAQDRTASCTAVYRSLKMRMNEVDKLISQSKCPTCLRPISKDFKSGMVDEIKRNLLEAEENLKEAKEEADVLEVIYDIVELINDKNRILSEKPKEPSNSQIKELGEKIVNLKKKIKDIDYTILNNLKVLDEAFGPKGIRSEIIKTVLPVINDTVNRYLIDLSDNDLSIELSAVSDLKSGKSIERFSINVISSSGKGYHSCSGGERRRIDFALALALQSILPRVNLFVCDEPFESVDSGGQELFVRLLDRYAREFSSGVYVVTHIPTLSGLFDKEIQIVRNNGISRVIS